VRWLFPGKEIRIEARCLDCGESIMVRTKDEELLEAKPENIVGHITLPIRKWSEVTNAFL
jgi:hypothetical protein